MKVEVKFVPGEHVEVDGTEGFIVTGGTVRRLPDGTLGIPFFEVSWMMADASKSAHVEEYRIVSSP